MKNPIPAQLIDLTYQAMEGMLDQDSLRQLESLLLENDEYRTYFVEVMTIHGLLHQAGVCHDASKTPPAQLTTPLVQAINSDLEHSGMPDAIEKQQNVLQPDAPLQHHRNKPNYRIWIRNLGQIAAIITIALLIFNWIDRQANLLTVRPGPSLARVIQNSSTRWQTDSAALITDNQAHPGQYQLEQGRAQFIFNNGTELIVEAPASLNLQSQRQVQIERGKISVRIYNPQNWIQIDTPSAGIRDLGTVFGVKVTSDRQTETHVFQGSVDVSSRQGSVKQPLRLTEGQAVACSDKGYSEIFDAVRSDFSLSFTQPNEVSSIWLGQTGSSWFDPGNWHNQLVPDNSNPNLMPGEVCKAKINIAAHAKFPCILDRFVEVQWLHNGGGDSPSFQPFQIVKNGYLKVTATTDGWFITGYDGPGITEIFSGATLDCENAQCFTGFNSEGTLIVNGGLVKCREFQIGPYSGYGTVLLRGGEIQASSLIIRNGILDIAQGQLILPGDKRNQVQTFIDDGILTGYGGAGRIVLEFDQNQPAQTIVRALPPEGESVTGR